MSDTTCLAGVQKGGTTSVHAGPGRTIIQYIRSLLTEVPSPQAAPTPAPFRKALRPNIRRQPDGVPLVSLIVLNRDGAALLDALFDSLHRHETWPALEILVVDHASQDDSLAVVERWGASLPLRALPRTENHSFSYSNNRAAEEARGEILLFVNNDIVLTEPIIARLVAAVQDTGGIVGVRQFENVAPDADGARPWHHVGVRWDWNPLRRISMPHNVAPGPGDSLLASAVCEMPAVTGSVMACRGDDYRALGGMCEAYFYGYEDIDLCCAFRYGLGRPVVSLNDLTVLHGDGLTRKRTGSSARRTAIHRANMRILDERWGHVLWRAAVQDALTDDGSILGRTPRAVMLGACPAAVAEALAVGGWECAFLQPGWRRADLRNARLTVTADPDIRWPGDRLRSPHLVRVAWTVGGLDGWLGRPDLGAHDLVVAADATAAERLRAAGAAQVAVLPAGGAPLNLRAALLAARRDGGRVAIVGRREAALAMVRDLGHHGLSAWVADGRAAGSLDAADVVVRLGECPCLEITRAVIVAEADIPSDALASRIRQALVPRPPDGLPLAPVAREGPGLC